MGYSFDCCCCCCWIDCIHYDLDVVSIGVLLQFEKFYGFFSFWFFFFVSLHLELVDVYVTMCRVLKLSQQNIIGHGNQQKHFNLLHNSNNVDEILLFFLFESNKNSNMATKYRGKKQCASYQIRLTILLFINFVFFF